jgi:hypothetical protein
MAVCQLVLQRQTLPKAHLHFIIIIITIIIIIK